MDLNTLSPEIAREVSYTLFCYPQAKEALDSGTTFDYRPINLTGADGRLCLWDEETERFLDFTVTRGLRVETGSLYDVRWLTRPDAPPASDECDVSSARYQSFRYGYTREGLAATWGAYYLEVADTADDYLNVFDVPAKPVATLDARLRSVAEAAWKEACPPCSLNSLPATQTLDQLALPF